MKVVFYASDKPREIMLADAFRNGVHSIGDEFELRRTADYGEDRKYEGPSPDTDVAVFFGVKGQSAGLMRDHLSLGKGTIYLDKGLTRQKGNGGHTLYTRISINGPTPLSYFQRVARPSDRFHLLGLNVERRKDNVQGGHVLFCGSSQKYHDFNGLGDADEYAEKVLFKLRKACSRQLVYRPKPSSLHEAQPIPGYLFSNGSQDIKDALRGCHCLVTHGSSVAIFAVLAGVNIIVLGDGLAQPVAETDLTKVDKPYWPSGDARTQWAFDMAYCQWTTDELQSGAAWKYCREELSFMLGRKK